MTDRRIVPTIKDVAREAGVSIKTVSRVMNSEKGVRPPTAAHVRDVAKALGYTVNLAARQLVSRRTGSIGIMVYASRDWQWTADLVTGALMQARSRAYGLVPFVLEHYEQAERDAVLWLAARHAVDGVLLTTPWNENALLKQELTDRGMPFVLLLAPTGATALGVRSRDDDGAAALAKHLIDLGHRRFGLIGGQPDIGLTTLKLRGFERALQEAGIDPASGPRELADYTFATGYRVGRAMLTLVDRPTALFCLSDMLGAGALRAAHELGVGVPSEVSIVGMGDLMAGRIVWPALTTVAIPTAKMAAQAADLLLDQVQFGRTGGQVAFETNLIVRESCGPAPT